MVGHINDASKIAYISLVESSTESQLNETPWYRSWNALAANAHDRRHLRRQLYLIQLKMSSFYRIAWRLL